MEDRKSGRVVTHIALGRSGASIRDGLVGPRTNGDPWAGGKGEIDELFDTIGKRPIDALLVYIGINDIGVSGTLKDLVTEDFGNDDKAARDKLEQEAFAVINDFPTRFAELELKLGKLNFRDVYFVEYPTGLFNNSAGDCVGGCGVFSSHFDMELSGADTRMLLRVALKMNEAIKKEVTTREKDGKHWHYIGGVAAIASKHGYCTGDGYFIEAEQSVGFQGDTEGSVHPTQRYHKQIALLVMKAVEPRMIADGGIAGGIGRTPVDENPPRRASRSGAGQSGRVASQVGRQ